MKPKTIKITYWILVSLLCLFMAADAYGGITMQQAGVDALKHLGYSPQIMPLFGWLKVLGIIALLQTRFSTVKEWVFAGLVFIFIGASVSHICSKDPVTHILMPLAFIALTFAVRALWYKYSALTATV